MAEIPLHHALLLAGGLFALGLIGVMVRRNLIFMLLSLELLLNGGGLALIAAGARWGDPSGQAMFIFVLALAAAEVAVALALVLQLQRRTGDVDVDRLGEMRD